MKRLLSLLLIATLALSLTACDETPPTAGNDSPTEAEATPTEEEPTEATPSEEPPSDCTCLVCVPQVFDSLEEEINDFMNEGRARVFPVSNKVNDIDIYYLLGAYLRNYWLCESVARDKMYSDEAWSDFWHFYPWEENNPYTPHYESNRGVKPAQLEEFIREYLNDDFRIESYDYKSKTRLDYKFDWAFDPEKELLVYDAPPMCGGPLYPYLRVSEIREITENEFHVYALRTITEEGYSMYEADFLRYTVTRNANGNLNISSVQSENNSEYAWVVEFNKLRTKLEKDSSFARSSIIELIDADVYFTLCDKCPTESLPKICDTCVKWSIPVILGNKFIENLNLYY